MNIVDKQPYNKLIQINSNFLNINFNLQVWLMKILENKKTLVIFRSF
jgi:hypothetical protein